MSRSKLSERLTAASLQELIGLILRSGDPVDSVELVASIFELVRAIPCVELDLCCRSVCSVCVCVCTLCG